MKINRYINRLTHVQWAAILFTASIVTLFGYYMSFIHIAQTIPEGSPRNIYFSCNLAIPYAVLVFAWWAVKKLDKNSNEPREGENPTNRMNKICFIKGHDTDPKFNDNGYLVCRRCASHEYYDQDGMGDFYTTLPHFKRMVGYKFSCVKSWSFFRCGDCEKVRHICGINVGNHDNCLPF